MLPYQEAGKKLENLLEKLFRDDGESIREDVEVLKKPVGPGPKPFSNCCAYNYGSY